MKREAKDRRAMLKVKLKSLAEEARIIRREEKSARGWLRTELHEHRVRAVRSEARHTHLAYAIVRGKHPSTAERSNSTPDWMRVKKMVEKYGPTDVVERTALIGSFLWAGKFPPIKTRTVPSKAVVTDAKGNVVEEVDAVTTYHQRAMNGASYKVTDFHKPITARDGERVSVVEAERSE